MKKSALAAAFGLLLTSCASSPPTIPPVSQVDLPRFMGKWYVIAHVEGPFDKGAHNAVETYALRPDGRIATVYQQRKGSFDAPEKTMHPVGRVVPGTGNAVWGMQFMWPIQAEYVIVDIAPDYSDTIVARSKRDYAWIMARTPIMDEARYRALVKKLVDMGYDASQLRRVPQRWPAGH
ncbi:lipocalin family protein [Solilutibacter tolerans]|uniref:Outer membrane lipoprotein Blc n=1 Tax=Solilutibacter tolerans TaxID=1604334 RepID=A0A1N6QLA9_9GAMM|nr:lipocalin family protein [Lysobacter tolerans]SIQ17360.1 apolipoprotein D and lipocalin family protein [Lysobacter tolerans]